MFQKKSVPWNSACCRFLWYDKLYSTATFQGGHDFDHGPLGPPSRTKMLTVIFLTRLAKMTCHDYGVLRKSFISIKKHIKKPYPCETKFHDFFRNHWTHVDSEITKTKSLVARSRIANNWCPRCWSCIEYLGPQPPTVTTIGVVFPAFSRRLFLYISPWKWWNEACLRHEKLKYYNGNSNCMYFQKNGLQTFFWHIQISATFRWFKQRNDSPSKVTINSIEPSCLQIQTIAIWRKIPTTIFQGPQGIPASHGIGTNLDGPDVGRS